MNNGQEKIKGIIANQEQKIFVYGKILETVKEFDGKVINARIKTKLAEKLPMYTIAYMNTNTSWREIKVWGQGLDYNSMVTAHIYNPSGKGGYTRFEDEASTHVEAIAQIEAWIKNMGEGVVQLKYEAGVLPQMLEDFKALNDEIAERVHHYGTVGIGGDKDLSYTVRGIIEAECAHIKF